MLLRDQIFQFILNYLIFSLNCMHDNANVVYVSMFSDYIYLNTGFIFENHIKPTPYIRSVQNIVLNWLHLRFL